MEVGRITSSNRVDEAACVNVCVCVRERERERREKNVDRDEKSRVRVWRIKNKRGKKEKR